MQKYNVYTFNVGQGLFNLVIGVTNDGSPYTAVFDCGNMGKCTCLDKACNILKTTPGFSKINDVVISHQDIDHWKHFLRFIVMLNNLPLRQNQWYISFQGNKTNMIYFNAKYLSQLVLLKIFNRDYVTQTVHLYLNKSIDAQVTSQIFPFSRFWTIQLDYKNIGCSLSIAPSFSPQGLFFYTMTTSSSILTPLTGYIQSPCEIKDTFILFAHSAINSEKVSDAIINIVNKAFDKMLFDTSCIPEIIASSYHRNTSIQNLYLGGMDCQYGYTKFKQTAAFFADNVTEGESLLSIYPDSGGHVLHDSSLIDYVIMDKNGIFLPTSGGVYRNATSIVSAVHVSDTEFLLFPGDATVHTFQQLCALLPQKQLLLLLAPHHGSYDTNCAFTRNSTGRPSIVPRDTQPLEELLRKFPPYTVVISARYRRYGHPSQFFLNMSIQYCQINYNTPHGVIYCYDNCPHPATPEDTDTATVTKAVFSTESNSVNNYIAFPPPDTNSVRTERRTELPPDHLFL